MNKVFVLFTSVLLLVVLGCAHKPERDVRAIEGVRATPTLEAHTDIFRKGIERVADNVYVAIGYGLANCTMIEGNDGIIIVDTLESREVAMEVFSEFRKITDKPVKAIIYTHNHVDHIFGAEVFAQGTEVAIYAHDLLPYFVSRLLSKMRPVIDMRSMRMFGTFLDEEGLVNSGIGPFLGLTAESTTGYLPPTVTFSKTLQDEVAGIRFELVHAPGETDDQIFVWLPENRVMLSADNFYWTFPNLYTIRGTPYRSLQQWYRSLDSIRDYKADYLVPGHTRPIIGAETIEMILRDYRDAIQFVHDQTIRGINRGMTPDELAEHVMLPPHLAEAPYLQPFYGKVSWTARSVFSGNLGWFDGDSASLHPLGPKDQALLMARLAGGEMALMDHAEDLLAGGDYQAALQLTGHVVHLNPDNQAAKDLRVKALVALGEREENPNARHYYLTEALEIRDNFIAMSNVKPDPKQVNSIPLEGYFEFMQVSLDPEASADTDTLVGMVFTDTHKACTIHVRRGVAEIRSWSPNDLEGKDLDIKVLTDEWTFKELLAKLRNPVITLATLTYEKGNAVSFGRVLRLFSQPDPKLPYEPLR